MREMICNEILTKNIQCMATGGDCNMATYIYIYVSIIIKVEGNIVSLELVYALDIFTRIISPTTIVIALAMKVHHM